ncbi:uncharacterized protein CIMG_05338 [Coccidioides immitis RS]|uniref:Uncharacterized protein n=1 Tax=Coccidioides immitis (strain RS) TaxID=246410 RepID=J3KFC5_COCIM|nr:uncharacterized protein CIMG_05338 [Coccidioides immitis RS]EAS34314.3 hypothetical protein CIMG_05338 [Coccidioides immitis RS]
MGVVARSTSALAHPINATFPGSAASSPRPIFARRRGLIVRHIKTSSASWIEIEGEEHPIISPHNIATFTYDITSSGPANCSPSPWLHMEHLLWAYTPDPRSDEVHQHLLPMPMPMPVPLTSASGDLSKDAASEVFADFSALPSTVSGLDDINWDEWILFDSPPVNVPPPSLQLSDFSDDPIEEAHPSPSDVADDPSN